MLFFFKATATTEIYTYGHTLSRHDALPIRGDAVAGAAEIEILEGQRVAGGHCPPQMDAAAVGVAALDLGRRHHAPGAAQGGLEIADDGDEARHLRRLDRHDLHDPPGGAVLAACLLDQFAPPPDGRALNLPPGRTFGIGLGAGTPPL